VQWWCLGKIKAAHIEERLHESDEYLEEVVSVIAQLKDNARRLEEVLRKIREEDA
jgi:hypothetical protein